MRENDKVTALIVTYNRKRLLERCLRSLFNQEHELHQICVIDNNSTDGTPELVAEFQKQGCIDIAYIRLTENLGGAGGFREGFRWALERGDWDWLLVMDDDAAPDREYVKRLLEQSHNNPDIRCLTGTEYVGDTMRISYGGRRVIDKASTMRTALVPKEWYGKESFCVDTATFVGLMIHANVVQKVGLPDADFFIYYDDTDYCFRIRKYTKILHVTGARIVHREDFENDVLVEGQQEWRQFYLYRNELVIKKRHIKHWYIRYAWIARAYLRKIRDILKGENEKGHKIRIVTRATMDVLLNRLGKADYVK